MPLTEMQKVAKAIHSASSAYRHRRRQAFEEGMNGPPLGWDLTLPVIRWNLVDAAYEWGRMAAAA